MEEERRDGAQKNELGFIKWPGISDLGSSDLVYKKRGVS